MAKLNDTPLGVIRDKAEEEIRRIMRKQEFKKFINRGLRMYHLPEKLIDANLTGIEMYKIDNNIINAQCTTEIMGKAPMYGFAKIDFELIWKNNKFKFVEARIYSEDYDDWNLFSELNFHKPVEIKLSSGKIQLFTNSKDPIVEKVVRNITGFVDNCLSIYQTEFQYAEQIKRALWQMLPDEKKLEDGSWKNIEVVSVFVEVPTVVKITINEYISGPIDTSSLGKNKRSLIDGFAL